MRLTLLLRNKPKTILLTSAIIVFSLFIAAYQKKEKKKYHSDNFGNEKVLLNGDLPGGSSDMFMGSGRCAGCHGLDLDMNNLPLANFDELGNQVSPAENWRGTMMANSAKDPMWRAKVAHEIAINPAHENELVNKCTSCHAPLGRFEAQHDNIEFFTMEMLDADSLARDGVSCMACHSQQIELAGNFFSGELHYNADTVWGPVFDIPKADMPVAAFIMESFVGVTPVPHDKFAKSETCAGCHTLLTHTSDLEGNYTGTTFIEQATYHEWLNSAYNVENNSGQECQGCHMPQLNEPIVIASGYDFLPGRQPFGQHWLVGGNSFMLELMKNNMAELELTADISHFETVINRTLDNLQNHSASIAITPGIIDGDTARYTVKLTNKAGHKLPSGYPSRRAYIELVMTDDDGNEIFHSGKLLPDYNIQGQDAGWEPHYDLITDEDQVQIYEMVMGDVLGNVTTVLERADHPIKDNRLTPLGFSTTSAVYDSTAIVGTAELDPNFNVVNGLEGSGTDEVSYHIPVSGFIGNVTVSARLMYQSIPPRWNEEMFSIDDPVINEFEEMYLAEGPDPVQMVTTEVTSTIIGIKESSAFFVISPNPTTNGIISIDAGKDIVKSIGIYSMDGKLVETIHPNSSRTQIRLPFIIGTYLLDVTTSRGRKVERVMRQ